MKYPAGTKLKAHYGEGDGIIIYTKNDKYGVKWRDMTIPREYDEEHLKRIIETFKYVIDIPYVLDVSEDLFKI